MCISTDFYHISHFIVQNNSNTYIKKINKKKRTKKKCMSQSTENIFTRVIENL